MKISSVELVPANSSETIELSFKDPQGLNKYNVRTITGLDVDQINRRSYVSQYSGSSRQTRFSNLTPEKRSISVVINLNPDFGAGDTYSDLRDDIYRLIASSRTGMLTLQFKNGTSVIATISGYVNKVEAPQFEKNQNVVVFLDCEDGLLRAPVATSIDVSSLDPADTVITDSLSTAPHGMTFALTVLTDTTSLFISDPNDVDLTWSFKVTPSGGFDADDVIYFSSIYNDKYIRIERPVLGDWDIIYLADLIEAGSSWPIIFPGENHFAIENPTHFEWTEIKHYPTYWGV